MPMDTSDLEEAWQQVASLLSTTSATPESIQTFKLEFFNKLSTMQGATFCQYITDMWRAKWDKVPPYARHNEELAKQT